MTLKETKMCKECNGAGEFSTMEEVEHGNPQTLAPVGTRTCDNCYGKGEEQDVDIIREIIVENLTKDQEDVLRNIHAENYSGTDDDMVDNFEKWLENLTVMDLESYLE